MSFILVNGHAQPNGQAMPFWIGLTDEGSEGDWYWEHTHHKPDISAWDIDFYSSGGTNENCALHYNSVWHDYPCFRSVPFICEK